MANAKRTKLIIGIAVIVLFLTDGCAKKIETTQMIVTPPKLKQQAVIASNPTTKEQPKSIPSPVKLEDIFFAFDKALLTSSDRQQLDKDILWINENSYAKITIEGHCDERGTGEYNLVLGERRAASAKKYLESAGIDPTRIKTISYGMERPFCKQHNEQCWQQNRRDHIVKMLEGS